MRLDDLIRLAPASTHDSDRILKTKGLLCVLGTTHEIINSALCPLSSVLVSRLPNPMLPARTEISTNRMQDHNVWPPRQTPQNLVNIALNVPIGIYGRRLQVAGPCVVAFTFE